MKQNKLLVLLILILCCSSCKRQEQFLAPYDDINSSPYGSLAKLKCKDGITYKGELIALADGKVYLLSVANNNKLLPVPISEITEYNLKFARSKKNYKNWMTLGFTSLSHGWFSIITIIPNLVIPSSLSKAEQKEYSVKHSMKDPLLLDVDHPEIINRFCRFPQGVPEGVDLRDIKPID